MLLLFFNKELVNGVKSQHFISNFSVPSVICLGTRLV